MRGTIVVQHTVIYISYNAFPLCTVCDNNAAFRDTHRLQGLFLSHVHVLPDRGTISTTLHSVVQWIHSCIETLLIEKLLLGKAAKRKAGWTEESAGMAAPVWAVEARKNRQESDDLQWGIFFNHAFSQNKDKASCDRRRFLMCTDQVKT